MDFTDKELKLIHSARVRIKQAFYVRILSMAAIVCLLALFLAGRITPEVVAYTSVVLVVISVAYPQLGAGPKYEQLVKLLASKCSR